MEGKRKKPRKVQIAAKRKQQLVITTKNPNSQTLLYKHPDKVQMLLHEFIPRTNKDHKNKNGPKKNDGVKSVYFIPLRKLHSSQTDS